MLAGMLSIFICQLVGEVIVQVIGLPIPGAVIGMVILLIALVVNAGVPASLRKASEGLLSYLPLMLVPTGVGLMVHFELIAQDWLAIVVALVGSTLITFVCTALLLTKLNRSEKVK